MSFICQHCGKECKNLNSLRQHEIRCKSNPNKITVISNFSIYNNYRKQHIIPGVCQYCGKECKNQNSLRQHEIRCKSNPNKISVISNFSVYNNYRKHHNIPGTNQFTKARQLGLQIPTVTQETRNKISAANKVRLPIYWENEENRKRASLCMKAVVKAHPESYSGSNVNGRTPVIDYKGIKLNGSWEVLVAKMLDEYNIQWIRPTNPFKYEWNNNTHYYYPDFYLPEYDKYIEVKGYERERDKCKYKSVPNLIVIKRKEIELIKKNIFNIDDLIV